MSLSAAQLPDNIDELKEIVVSYDSEIKLLKEENRILKHRLFGRKSEKLPVGSGQLFLFNEAEAGEPEEQGTPAETIAVPSHERRRGCRKPLPDSLPRAAVVHDLTE